MEQQDLLPTEHRSLQQQRLHKYRDPNPERIYAAVWLKENRRHDYMNHGFTTLEWILCPDKNRMPLPVSRRDAVVAASVIQWLGTAVGLSFVRQCERKIDEARREADAKTLATLSRPSLLELEREDQAPVRRGMAVSGRLRA